MRFSGVLVCGSPGEVSNNKTLVGFAFDVTIDFQTAGIYNWNSGDNKRHAWVMINLSAEDQLRQRVSWVLAQILVVVTLTSAIGSAGDRYSENFLQYYDIFVRNAFGNYRDASFTIYEICA